MSHRYIYIIICLFFVCSAIAQEYTITKYDVSDGLPQTQTLGIMQDSKGFLWIWTKNGISKYDGKEFKNYGVEDGLPNNRNYGVTEIKNGRICVFGQNGISEYNGKTFSLSTIPEEYKTNKLNYRYITSSEHIFLTTASNDTVQLIKYKNRTYEIYTSFTIEGLNGKSIKHWLCNNNQSIFFEQNDTIYRLSKPIDKKSYIKPVFNGLNASVVQHNTNTYFITDTSFHRYTGHSTIKMDMPVMIENEIINPYHRHYKTGSSLNLYNDKHTSKLIWDSELISSTLLDKDSVLWITTEGGLYKLETTAFLNLFPRHGLIKNVWSVVEGNNGEMYFASLSEGVQKYENGAFSRVKAFGNYNETHYTHGSTRLSDGTMLFTGFNEILKYDGKTLTKLPWADTQVECIYENTMLNEIIFGSIN
ncbi:MAG TPA: hypothetical protein VJ951_13465, partial [Bacteroidales bacterium]|nr:hypothetical protein [Bacteroidales bacterium]